MTEPVSIGDLVYSLHGQGILPRPILCGRVVRLERPVGATHWEIWVEPALAVREPDCVLVLKAELNAARAAGEDSSPRANP